jgi:hypothetical protein
MVARLTLLPLLLVLSAGQAVAKSPWAQLAARDLQTIHTLLVENHPGAVDPEHPEFRRWLDDGVKLALALARTVDTPGGYEYAVRRYVAGFRDGHLGVAITLDHATLKWPGIIVALRDRRYRVHFVAAGEPELPPLGSELVACDGRDPAALMTSAVFPFEGDPALEAAWMRLAPNLLVDEGNPLRERPRACTFRTGAELRTVALGWRESPKAALADPLLAARFGARPALGQRDLRDGGVWISLPTFAPDDDQATQLRRIIHGLPELRARPLLVFDVRGNTGGNSKWGHELVQALFGPTWERVVAPTLTTGQPLAVDWRASPGNQRYVAELVHKLEHEFADDPAIARSFAKVASGLEAALAAHRPFYRETDGDDAPAGVAAAAPAPTAVHARVVLLTDGRCGSACLDFADALLPQPGVVHAGLPTYADSPFMEARAVPLPSGIATLHLPIKVYRHRARDHRPYVPRLRYDGDPGDTAALERWLRAALERADSDGARP